MKLASTFGAHLRAAGLAIEIDAAGFERLREYFALRSRWSRTHNLSGPAALDRPWEADALDTTALVQVADREAPLIDIGSGNGVPGLTFACLRPEHPVTLVEPRAKRVAFLRTAVRALQLPAVRVIRGRWPMTVPAGQLVSRAVVSPEAWPRLAAQDGVVAVIRYLAAQRPVFDVDGFELAEAVDYQVEAQARRIERWISRPPAPPS